MTSPLPYEGARARSSPVMAKLWGTILLLCVAGPSIAQNADLRLTASASPSSYLVLDREVLVTTTIVNAGPDAAQGTLLVVSGVPFQEFPFEIVGSETPGCLIEFLDIDPVRFNYIWAVGSIPAGASFTCVARLRVRAVPASLAVTLTAEVTTTTPDPVSVNNTVPLGFSFGVPPSRLVPATGLLTLTLLTMLLLAVGRVFFQRIDG